MNGILSLCRIAWVLLSMCFKNCRLAIQMRTVCCYKNQYLKLLTLFQSCRISFVVCLLKACFTQQQPVCMILTQQSSGDRSVLAGVLLCVGQCLKIPSVLQGIIVSLKGFLTIHHQPEISCSNTWNFYDTCPNSYAQFQYVR